jgi:D-alanyl-lipoteichoic acid acyltransferase DltB (MBOAT superfamily)
MITMVLGGLWHGAAWTFILWGLYHGAILCLYRIFAPGISTDPDWSRPVRVVINCIQIAFFFCLTCYSWLLFRATSLGQIKSFTRALFADSGAFSITVDRPPVVALLSLLILLMYECAEYRARSPEFYRTLPSPIRGAFYATLIFLLLMGTNNESTQFIYFQF